jgi:hypothetical protein
VAPLSTGSEPDIYLQGIFTDKMCRSSSSSNNNNNNNSSNNNDNNNNNNNNNPSTKDDLKEGIQVVVSSVSLAELYCAINNMFIRCDIFLPDKGNIPNTFFKYGV